MTPAFGTMPQLRRMTARVAQRLDALSRRRFLLLLLGILIVTRTAAVLILAQPGVPVLLETGVIARHLIAGEGYTIYYRAPVPIDEVDPEDARRGRPMPTAFTLPGYVAVVAATLAIAGDNAAGYATLYALNLLAAVACGLLLYALGRRLLGERGGRLAALLFSCYPPAIALTATFGGGPWYQLLICLALLAIARAEASGRTADMIGAGLTGGVWLLFRAEALALTALYAVWLGFRHGTRKAALFFGCVVLLALPWIIRNYLVFDALVPMTSNGWLNIWRGNNPEATGGSWHADGSTNWFDREQTMVQEFKNLPVTDRYELDVMAIYRERALAFMTEHPWQALRLYAKKVLMFLTIDSSDVRVYRKPFLIPHLLLSAFAIAGYLVLLVRRRGPALLLIAVGYYWLFIPLFHVETRYQIMLSVLTVLLAVAPFARGWKGGAGEAQQG